LKTIQGIIEYKDGEYDYTAELQASGRDWKPDRVTDLDRADGQSMSEQEADEFEDIEDLAIENARLLDWCERNEWEIEDSGGGCSALIKQAGQAAWHRITKSNDPSAPQTFKDSIAVCLYTADDQPIPDSLKIYHGGIDEMIQAGK